MDVRARLLNVVDRAKANERAGRSSDSGYVPGPTSPPVPGSASGSPQTRRRFLLRLAVALHSYGSSSPRTEYLMERAAKRLEVDIHIAVFPSLIAIAFPGQGDDSQETHLLTADSCLDVGKLGTADELATQVGQEGHEEAGGYWRLKSLATAPPLFSFAFNMLSFSVMSATATLLFFNGSLLDALLAAILGLLIGILDWFSGKSAIVGQISVFGGSTFVSFVARGLSLVDPSGWHSCYLPTVMGSLVWLLPGLSLTTAISEVVAGATVSGGSKVVGALLTALQIGFGMAVGDGLLEWHQGENAAAPCPPPGLSLWSQPLWFFLYTVASNVLLRARYDQWFGMIIVSGFGWLVSLATSSMGGDVSSVVAAFVIGVTGTLYARWTGHHALAMKTSAILLLVPGGIGVQGVAAILQDDVSSGMSFVVDMMVVGLAITLGLLMAKLVVPNTMYGALKKGGHAHGVMVKQLEEEAEEEGEMAI